MYKNYYYINIINYTEIKMDNYYININKYNKKFIAIIII